MIFGVANNGTIVPPAPLVTLFSTLTSAAIMIPSLLAFQALFFLNFRFRVNRKYYRQQKSKEPGPRLKFVPLPSLFVHPSLLFTGISLYTSGLVTTATQLVVSSFTCGMQCKWPGLVVLGANVIYILLSLAMVIHYHVKWGKATWMPAEPADTPQEVEDPLYRLVSKVRVRTCRKGRAFNIMDRARGEYAAPDEELEEPARTERLLHRPYRLFHVCSADAQQGMASSWMGRASGGFTGITYDYVCFILQTILAVVAGLSKATTGDGQTYLVVGSPAQVVAVVKLASQWGTALYVEMLTPSCDRVENHFQGVQFAIEGSSTFCSVLILFGISDSASMLPLTFLLATGAVFLPLIAKFYDAVVSFASQLCRKEKVDKTAVCLACYALLTAIPGAILLQLGLASSLDSNASFVMTSAADFAAGSAAEGVVTSDAGQVVAGQAAEAGQAVASAGVELAEAGVDALLQGAAMTSDAASLFYWRGSSGTHLSDAHERAKVIQRRAQAYVRGKIARRAVAKLRRLPPDAQRRVAREAVRLSLKVGLLGQQQRHERVLRDLLEREKVW